MQPLQQTKHPSHCKNRISPSFAAVFPPWPQEGTIGGVIFAAAKRFEFAAVRSITFVRSDRPGKVAKEVAAKGLNAVKLSLFLPVSHDSASCAMLNHHVAVLEDVDPSHWVYRAEGNANIVLSYSGSHQSLVHAPQICT